MRHATARQGTTPTIDARLMLDLAHHMANRADEMALEGFASHQKVEFKSDGSPVTRFDRDVESMLRETIEREDPRAGVLGEEFGEEAGIGRWVFDPIDGTREFVNGDPRFAVLIAFEVDGDPKLAVVSAPALDLRWWAAEGTGTMVAYRGSVSKARVSPTRRLARARGMLRGEMQKTQARCCRELGGVDERLSSAGARIHRRGASWEAVRVADGEYDFALTTGDVWDVAPIPILVREAGGRAWVHSHGGGLRRVAVSNRYLAPYFDDFAA